MSPLKAYHASKKPRKLAETTRKFTPKVEEDANDPETIAGMKGPVEVEREKVARARAALMLQKGFM